MTDAQPKPTKTYTIRMEVSTDLTAEQVHEYLCKAVHEMDQDSLEPLMDNVVDITLLDPDQLPYYTISDEDQKKVFDYITDGNDRNDLITTICERLTEQEVTEILGREQL